MTAAPNRPRIVRRPLETSEALLEATTSLLYEVGYSGISTTMIPARAGVTRGALQHHFGTKSNLMVALVQQVYERETALYRSYFTGAVDFHISHLPMVIWEVLSRPSGIAVLEILNGSRSDAELAEKLLPIQTAIEQDSLDMLSKLLKLDRQAALKTVRLIVWSVRGLSVLKGLGVAENELRDCINLLCELFDCADAVQRADIKEA